MARRQCEPRRPDINLYVDWIYIFTIGASNTSGSTQLANPAISNTCKPRYPNVVTIQPIVLVTREYPARQRNSHGKLPSAEYAAFNSLQLPLHLSPSTSSIRSKKARLKSPIGVSVTCIKDTTRQALDRLAAELTYASKEI